MIKIIMKSIYRAPIYHTGRFTIRDIQKFVFQTISRLDAKLTYHLEVVVFIIIIFFITFLELFVVIVLLFLCFVFNKADIPL